MPRGELDSGKEHRSSIETDRVLVPKLGNTPHSHRRSFSIRTDSPAPHSELLTLPRMFFTSSVR